ncbi:hypothetical protein YC2023_011621 [Brassica napus]
MNDGVVCGICNSYPTNKIQNLKNFIEHATSKSKQRRRRRESSPAPPSRSDRHRRGGELPNEDLEAERIREKTLALYNIVQCPPMGSSYTDISSTIIVSID